MTRDAAYVVRDETAKKFDEWAHNGKAEEMEREHTNSVTEMLRSARFGDGFTFLDVGCGSGWVVRKVARHPGCSESVGIDKSPEMICRARTDPRNTGKERYLCTDIERWPYRGRKFDHIFAMESIYYANSIESALTKIYGMLKPGGVFLCGTDFYAENAATKRWPASMGVTMHLHSEEEWRALFAGAGFRTRLRHIRDPAGRTVWKREIGTLFITGTKQPPAPNT